MTELINTIGFIGTGVMGEPMCRHLAGKSGHRVLGTDRDPAPLQRLAEAGVETAAIEDIAAEAEIVFLSLPSGEVVRSVVAGVLIDRMPRSRLIVDLSTSPVALTRELAAQCESRGLRYADAPVMRTRAAAEAGALAIPVGATEEDFAQIEPLLRCFATDVMYAGLVGAGQIVKILNNMVLYETVLALSEARAIGARAGVDPGRLFEALSKGSADSFALRNHGLKAIVPQVFPERAFPVSYARKDLQCAIQLAEEVGVNATGARNLLDCFDQAITAGHGEKYAPAISLIFEAGK